MQNSIIKLIVSVIISLGLSSISAAISVYQYFTLHLYMQQRQQYEYKSKKVGKRRSTLFLKYLLMRLRYRGDHIRSQLPSGKSSPYVTDDSVTVLKSAGSAVATSSNLGNWAITNSNLAIDSVTSDKIINNRAIADNDTRRSEDISSKIDSSSDLYF